jgi:preprotein translocase subunit SecE
LTRGSFGGWLGRRGFVERIATYVRESKAELKKVAWPTRQQVWYSTLVVLFFTLVVAAYLGLVDMVLTGVFGVFLK